MISWLLVAAGLLLAALVLLPLRLSLRLDSAPAARLRLVVGVLALPPRWTLVDTARPRSGGRDRPDRPAGSRAPADRAPVRRARVLAALPRAGVDLLRRVRVESCHLEVLFGLGDPAATGELFGRLIPLTAARWAMPPGSVLRLEPDFASEVLEGQGAIVLRVIPVLWIAPLVRLAWALR